MLEDPGSIPQETLQDRLNLGNVCFCPIRRTLRMQCIFLDHLWKLIAKGVFMPPPSEETPELSQTTAILLVFQADGQHEKITDVYVGLIVGRVESHLYTPDQILDFIRDIEGDLQVAQAALKAEASPARGTPFSSLSVTMGVPCPFPWIHHTASSTQPVT